MQTAAKLLECCVIAVFAARKEEHEACQQSAHSKQQHVYEVCCAKLKGDLLQLGAILNAAEHTKVGLNQSVYP